MVSVINPILAMDLNGPISTEDGEILEDGELDDADIEEEEVANNSTEKSADIVGSPDQEDHESSNDDKKKKKKRRKHKDERSKRKRKKHSQGTEGNEESPQSKKRRKRKKRTRDTTSPESDLSSEYSRRSASMQRFDSIPPSENYEYYGYGSVPGDGLDYTDYSENNNQSNISSNNYVENEEEIDNDDFESQLANYQKYKTSGNKQIKNSVEQYCEVDIQPYKGKKNQYGFNKNKSNNQNNSYNRNENKQHRTKSSNQQSRLSRWNSKDTGNSQSRSKKRGQEYQQEQKFNNHKNNSYNQDEHYSNQNEYAPNQPEGYDTQIIKKTELCKYYLNGHCHHGNSCTYMHEEYPCKYFHTGTHCFAGEACKFSHDPPNETTKIIVEKLQDVLTGVDDSWEVVELKKHGITPKVKPPPGQGLLPTPTAETEMPNQFQAMMAAAMVMGQVPNFPPPNPFIGIPSIFDLNVEPTPDFQERIDKKVVTRAIREMEAADMLLALSEVPSLKMIEEFDAKFLATHGSHGTTDNNTDTGTGASETEVMQDQNVLKQCSRTPPWLRKDDSIPDAANQESQPAIDTEQIANELKAPDFLPTKQKELFMRIHHKASTQEASKENTPPNKISEKDPNTEWSYSSDEDNTALKIQDCDVIKMDTEEPTTPVTTQSSVQTIVNMIKSKSDNGTVDKNLLSKVASVINMAAPATTSNDLHYTPTLENNNSYAVKESPKHSSHHRERKSSSSSTGSGSSRVHHHHHPLRKRISTQELHKEPVIIPLVPKENTSSLHSAHPDPRMSLSKLFGTKKSQFVSEIPPFCKDIVLASGKLKGLKITLSSESKSSHVSSKRSDPRLQRKDPRTAKSDPRLRRKETSNEEEGNKKTLIPPTPPALITKTSTPIPSLPELNLDMASIVKNNENIKPRLPQIPLPKLKKAPVEPKNPELVKSILTSNNSDNDSPPTIAPYDPRYMTGSTTVKQTPVPYDPRTQTNTTFDTTNTSEKRTIQLPKLTIAPTFKNPTPGDMPAGDQCDF